MNRGWQIAFRICALMGAIPLAFARHLPFADLPEHLATIATLRNWWTPGWHSQDYFFVENALRSQFLLFDYVAAALAFPLATAERSVFVLLVGTALGFPYALRALMEELDHDPRYGLLAVPLFWSRVLGEGLIPFIVSIPVTVYGLALVLRHLKRPTDRRRTFGLAGLAAALLYLHIASFVVFLVGTAAAFVLMGNRHGERLKAWRKLIWLAPAIALLGVYVATSTVTHPDAALAHATTVKFAPTQLRLSELWEWMHDFWTSRGDDAAAVVAWLGAACALVASRRTFARWSFAFGALMLALAFGLYVALPTQVGFAFLLDLRMAPYVGMFAALLLVPEPGRLRELGAKLVAVATIALGIHGAVQMQQMEHREARHIDEVLRRLPPGKRLLTLAFDARSEYTNVAPYLHVGGYYRARYGGIASFSFAEIPHWPVRYRPEMAPPTKPIVFWDFEPCQYRNTVDGRYYDYVLVRSAEDPLARPLPGPRFRLIGSARDLRLYERIPGSENPGEDLDGPCPLHSTAAVDWVEDGRPEWPRRTRRAPSKLQPPGDSRG